jgi:hypothetical protein
MPRCHDHSYQRRLTQDLGLPKQPRYAELLSYETEKNHASVCIDMSTCRAPGMRREHDSTRFGL